MIPLFLMIWYCYFVVWYVIILICIFTFPQKCYMVISEKITIVLMFAFVYNCCNPQNKHSVGKDIKTNEQKTRFNQSYWKTYRQAVWIAYTSVLSTRARICSRRSIWASDIFSIFWINSFFLSDSSLFCGLFFSSSPKR